MVLFTLHQKEDKDERSRVTVSYTPHADEYRMGNRESVVCVMKVLPCQPSDEAAGIVADDEFSRLVQTASKKGGSQAIRRHERDAVLRRVYLHD